LRFSALSALRLRSEGMTDDPKPPQDDPADDDGWFDDDAEDDLDLFEDECGGTDDGTCIYAGSEWCDFSCPLRRLRDDLP
jgi:hypothetical protein